MTHKCHPDFFIDTGNKTAIEIVVIEKIGYKMERTKQEILNCATDCISRNIEMDKEFGCIHDAAHYVLEAKHIQQTEYFFRRHRPLSKDILEEVWNEISPQLFNISENLTRIARSKLLQKTILSSSVKGILEPALEEAGLPYTIQYNQKCVILTLEVSPSQNFEAIVKYDKVQESLPHIIQSWKSLAATAALIGSRIRFTSNRL